MPRFKSKTNPLWQIQCSSHVFCNCAQLDANEKSLIFDNYSVAGDLFRVIFIIFSYGLAEFSD